MSIPNIFHKIKSKTHIDKATIIYLLIIVGVGIGSFGLGKLSGQNKDTTGINTPTEQQSFFNNNTLNSGAVKSENANIIDTNQREKRFVASKNGKMYYIVGCSGASRIKEENQVWFSSESDAQKSGYKLSTTCK